MVVVVVVVVAVVVVIVVVVVLLLLLLLLLFLPYTLSDCNPAADILNGGLKYDQPIASGIRLQRPSCYYSFLSITISFKTINDIIVFTLSSILITVLLVVELLVLELSTLVVFLAIVRNLNNCLCVYMACHLDAARVSMLNGPFAKQEGIP